MATLRVGTSEYNYDPGEITNQEGIAIEKVMGTTFDKWNALLYDGSDAGK